MKSFLISKANSRNKVVSQVQVALGLIFLTVLILSIIFLSSSWSFLVHYYLGDPIAPRINLSSLINKFLVETYAGLLTPQAPGQIPIADTIPLVNIRTKADDFMSLNRSIIDYGLAKTKTKPKIHAVQINDNGTTMNISLGYKGTNSWHHQYWKPSLQVKLKGTSQLNGFKSYSLIAPEDVIGVRNWLSDELARELGMLTYGEHFVAVYLNNRYLGLYTRIWPLDESLLIQERKLPGPFFRFESETGPVFRRKPLDFFKVTDWEIIGSNQKEARRILGTVLKQVVDKTITPDINEYLDQKEFAKYLAIIAHAGSIHVDTHNVALWHNVITGKLVPIPIDLNGYNWVQRGRNFKRPILWCENLILQAWLSNPKNLAAYIQELYKLIKNQAAYDTLKRKLDKLQSDLLPNLLVDPLTSGINLTNGMASRSIMSTDTLQTNFQSLILFIKEQNKWIESEIASNYSLAVFESGTSSHFKYHGYSPIIISKVDKSDFSMKGQVASSFTVYPTYNKSNSVAEATFTLGAPASQYTFVNAITQQSMLPVIEKHMQPITTSTLVEAMQQSSPSKEIHFSSGKHLIENDLILERGVNLRLDPGATLKLAPGVSIIAQGRVFMIGSLKSPIIIEPLYPNKPFGTVAILGQASMGSRLAHVQISGGSGAIWKNFFFSGMISIIDSPQIELSHLKIAGNSIYDDMLHIVGSHFSIRDSNFDSSFRDGIDLDQSNGEIVNTVLTNCGNDCLDISMGKVSIRGLQAFNCNDKCVSVGEGSQVAIDNSTLTAGNICVSPKDASQVAISSSFFIKCAKGISAYQKKWRWQIGGIGFVRDSKFIHSGEFDLGYDDKSIVTISGYAGQKVKIKGKSRAAQSRSKWPDWGC